MGSGIMCSVRHSVSLSRNPLTRGCQLIVHGMSMSFWYSGPPRDDLSVVGPGFEAASDLEGQYLRKGDLLGLVEHQQSRLIPHEQRILYALSDSADDWQPEPAIMEPHFVHTWGTP